MSPGGTDASLLELMVGLVAAVLFITVITMILRRRAGRRDLLGSQMREMEARAAVAAFPDAFTRIADARGDETASRAAAPAEAARSDAPTADPLAVDTASLGVGLPGVAAGDRPTQDGTAPPEQPPSLPGGQHDAMADAFAWLRIVALVEAGQREQAVELLSATMVISAEEAEMLVDGLNDAATERRPA